MGTKAAIAAIWILSACQASAGDITTSAGQPLCDTPDHLKEWLLASLQKQGRWMEELRESCTPLKPGLAVGIVEKVSGDVLDVLKVRVMGKTSGSMIGYTVSAGLKGYKDGD